MQIAIAGLGSSGSYLLRLLTNAGFDVSGFDPKREGFYIPCGYAANRNMMKDLLSLVDIEFSRYIESEADEITFSGSSRRKLRFRSMGLVTFDKNRLETDLLNGCKWQRKKLSGSFDLIVDATGISRQYLPAGDDYTMHTTEYLATLTEKEDFQFRYFPNGSGYFWIFPIGNKYHVGAGSSSMSSIRESLSPYSAEKLVSRDIRLKPLLHSCYKDNIIGIGEAIGTVSPITGEGIVPSMKSALHLFTAISRHNDIASIRQEYFKSVMKEFKRYYTLYDLLRNFQSGNLRKSKAISYISAARKDMRSFGIDVRITKAIREFM